MKVVGNIRWIASNLPFRRYLAGGSGMVPGLFFWRPIVKKVICRLKILYFMIIYRWKFPGNFLRTSGKSEEISRKIPGILHNPIPTAPTPYYCTQTQPPHEPHTPYEIHPLELQTRFSQYGKLDVIHRIFPTTFMYKKAITVIRKGDHGHQKRRSGIFRENGRGILGVL